MKKGIVSVIIILLFGAAVFYFGLVNMKVPAGQYGIMVSKTGGVNENIIENGKLMWRWEALLPTNVEIHKFDHGIFHSSQSLKGSLPSAEIYTSLIKGDPDFSYSFDYEISLLVTPENVVQLLKNGTVNSNESLKTYLEENAEKIAFDLSKNIIEQNAENLVTVFDVEPAVEQLKKSKKFEYIDVKDVVLKKAKIPDVRLYKIARKSYEKFQDMVDALLGEAAKEQAQKILADERSVNRLTKIGEVLKKYPDLNNLLSNGGSAEVLKALNNLE